MDNRHNVVVLFLALLLLAGCAAPPMPREVAQQGRVYLPTTPVAGYQWPARGFGHPPEAWSIGHEALIGEAPVWFYDWWWDCSRWLNDAGLYVPAVARAWYPAVLGCNDGRPLLVLNEPEEVGQAELTPEQAAAVLHAAAVSGWSGEIWCCGTQVQHMPYTRLLLAAYRAAYGAWPADGWHVHVYSQRDGRTHNATTLADVLEGLAALDAFVAWAQGEGVLGRGVVVSEFGALADSPIDLAILEAFEAEFGVRPEVLTGAWFSLRYEPWAGSDLVEADGRLTALGKAWTGADMDAMDGGGARGRVLRGD